MSFLDNLRQLINNAAKSADKSIVDTENKVGEAVHQLDQDARRGIPNYERFFVDGREVENPREYLRENLKDGDVLYDPEKGEYTWHDQTVLPDFEEFYFNNEKVDDPKKYFRDGQEYVYNGENRIYREPAPEYEKKKYGSVFNGNEGDTIESILRPFEPFIKNIEGVFSPEDSDKSDSDSKEESESKSESKKYDVDEMAGEFILGAWGNGQDRINNMLDAGYTIEDYNKIQSRVNEAYASGRDLHEWTDKANEKLRYW